MKNSKFFFPLFTMALLCFSCGTQKTMHNAGYLLSSKLITIEQLNISKPRQKEEKNPLLAPQAILNIEAKQKPKPGQTALISKEKITQKKSYQLRKPSDLFSCSFNPVLRTEYKSALSPMQDSSKPESTRILEKFGIIGAICSFVGVVSILTPFYFIGFWLCLLGIIFSIKSLHRINSHPNKYRGKLFAIVGLVLAILMFLSFLYIGINLGLGLSGF